MKIKPFVQHTGIAAALLRPNVDTDAIIPSREMKRVSKRGLSGGMFAAWRYMTPGGRDENPDFVLNQEPFRKATILLSGNNFGCGSSREHAVWALAEFGFRAIIAPSFGSIFYQNCTRNGILPIRLPESDVEAIAAFCSANPASNLVSIDLPAQRVVAGSLQFSFDIAAEPKAMLEGGLDLISLTLKSLDKIAAFEQARAAKLS